MLGFLKLYILISLSLFFAPVENLFHEVALFELQRRDKHAYSILKTISKTTKRNCALTCSLEQQCESFTFCKTKSCSLRSGELSANGSNVKSSGGCGNYGVSKEVDKTWQTMTKAGFKQATATEASPITQPPKNPCFPSNNGNGLKCIPFNEIEQSQ